MGRMTRRSLLVLGVGAAASMAGCSGGGDTDGGDTDGGDADDSSDGTTTEETTAEPTESGGDRPTTLAIENPVLCEEGPTGYQEYTEQPEGTYDPGDVVWVYFEPSTVGTEPAGEGEVRFEYDVTWRVRGPDGERVGTKEDTIEKTVPEGADLSSVFLTVSFSPPTEFDAGSHTMEIEVTDAIADTRAAETVEFDVESGLQHTSGEFGIGKFVFTETEAAGYDDYEEKPEAEYGLTDRVWYYYELDGFAYEETSNALTPDLEVVETLTGPEGEIWSRADIPLGNMFDPDVDLDTYYVADSVVPSEEWIPGEFTLRFDVTDGHTGESVTERYTFAAVE